MPKMSNISQNTIPNQISNLRYSPPKPHNIPPITEQWYFHNIREKKLVPFNFNDNLLIIDSKLRGVNDVIIRASDGKVTGTVKLDRMKFYLVDNMWYHIQSKPIELVHRV